MTAQESTVPLDPKMYARFKGLVNDPTVRNVSANTFRLLWVEVDRLAEALAAERAGTDQARREAAAEALRQAASEWAEGAWHDQWLADRVCDDVSAVQSTERWLLARADATEKGGEPR